MRSRRSDAAPLLVLALGTFAIGTDGFVIAGVLPGIARDTRTSVATAGLLVTAFALVYAVAAPLLTAASARVERRRILVAGMVVLAAANAAGALAPGYGWLMAARVVAALGAAGYSPVALAAAVALSPPEQRGRAVSRVLAGLTVSLVAGVPVGALLGSVGSWRWTFGCVAALSALVAIGIAALLPRVPAAPTSTLRARLTLLRQPAVVANLGATLLWITGAFVAYTFIASILRSATGWHGATLSALLLLYGAAAFAGNVAGGYAADRWGPRRTVTVALVSLVASLSAVAAGTGAGPPLGIPVVLAGMVAWAFAGWALTPAQSHRLVGLTPTAGPEVLSLNTSAVYLGIAAGASLGGPVLAHLGVERLGLVAAAFQLAALAVVAAPTASRAPARVPTVAATARSAAT